MPDKISVTSQAVLLLDLADYHQDVESSLRLYFTSANPNFVAIFAGHSRYEIAEKLDERIHETEMRSALAVMARVEAAFRLDYQWRRKANESDVISAAFRKYRKENIRLDEDIWETWKIHHPAVGPLIGRLRSAFRFRHWLAHGRYWTIGQKYDFQTVYLLAQAVSDTFPLRA